MYSLTKFAFILVLYFFHVNAFSATLSPTPGFSSQEIGLNNKLYRLEIADTANRKRQGLMYRTKLEQNAGMLFVYDKLGDYRIWMKNTLIPLTVIWLNEQARIIDKKILQPCRSLKCPVSAVSEPSKFILELHPSEYERFNVGDQLPFILTVVKNF